MKRLKEAMALLVANDNSARYSACE